MVKIIEIENRFFFLKNNKKINTPSGNSLATNNKFHADLVLQDMHDNKKMNNPFSIINLTFFSCDLSEDDRRRINCKIIELLEFDNILYRCFSESGLKKIMENKWNPLIDQFNIDFSANLNLLKTLMAKNNIKTTQFENYLDELDNFWLTTFFKLSTLTRSVILSYFFILKKIDYIELYKLSNLEYTYQQKRWGVVEEQKKVNQNTLNTIKNISFFFKNVN